MLLATDRKLQPPTIHPESKPFWDAAEKGVLLLRHCSGCDRPHYYPRPLCPFCFGTTEWRASAGLGAIYSYSVMRRAPEPYAIAFIALDEGVAMMSNVVDCDLDALHIGQRVKLAFKPSEGGPPLPMFTPD